MDDKAFGPFPTEQAARRAHQNWAILRHTPQGWFIFRHADDAVGHFTTRKGAQ